MVKIELKDLIEIVDGNMWEFSASGHMAREGASYFETPYELVATYDLVAVPYIYWQQEGFEHWITKERVEVNKGFIDRAQRKINHYVWSEDLGLPYDKDNANENVLEQMGAVKDI